MLKVTKFGGSSLADAKQFQKVAAIIRAEKERRYVVVSAPGKRFSGDEKVTDLLLRCYDDFSDGKNIEPVISKIFSRFDEIRRELNLKTDLEAEFSTIRETLKSGASRDYLASRGEYLNAILMAEYLGFAFVDAVDTVWFSEDGKLLKAETEKALAMALRRNPYAVIPGFYGSGPSGEVITFSRGGSDITGSLVAGAAKADLYENWTDVSGFLMADPRIVENPRAIDTVTYRELRELSYMGASVLHEDAIFPVRKANIPINIRNTNAPEDKGTMIVSSADNATAGSITGLAGKKGFSAIYIEKDMMNTEVGFGRKVLSVLEEEGISFEHLPSGIDTLSVVVATAALEGKKDRVIEKIREATSPDSITVFDELAILAVVGRGMIRAEGTASRIFGALAKENVNVRMIDQGSGELNIIIGIAEKDYDRALCAIYHAFEE